MALLETDAFSQVFRLTNREIWIVTAADGDRRGGLTATWVSQASLDPLRPMVVVAIAPIHQTAQLIQAGGGFGLHLIRRDQVDLACRFGLVSGRQQDKFSGLALTTAATGAPILQDCLAWLDCQVLTRLEVGDRILFWADVVAGRVEAAEEPLSDRELLAAATAQQRTQLAQNLDRDITALRPLHEAWRESLE
ncbi:MAG: flavin reductase family protein [Planctomycetota bacterium]|nr:flavin reductase family protein [Planctomycetota bacterium]